MEPVRKICLNIKKSDLWWLFCFLFLFFEDRTFIIIIIIIIIITSSDGVKRNFIFVTVRA